MITARTTRLVRVPDLQTFRQTVAELACGGTPLEARHRLVVVPTRAAAAYLTAAIERGLDAAGAVALPDFVTRDELCARLGERLAQQSPSLGAADREVLMGAACRAALDDGAAPPFLLRPALVAEILRFYDALQLNLTPVDTFERLALGMLEPGALEDRGAERLVAQTRFLAAAFRRFENLMRESGGLDEHLLRERLLREAAAEPWRHVVVAVGDRASDPYGLRPAEWDLLARVPGLERFDVVTTDAAIAGAPHERMHRMLPGIEETRVASADVRRRPALRAPAGGGPAHVARDREEEVALFARMVRHERLVPGTVEGLVPSAAEGPAPGTVEGLAPSGVEGLPLDRAALVVRRPLPYVYMAREVLRSAGVPSQMFDALPLAAEPFAAALDLVFTAVASDFARGPAVALLRSPHFEFGARGDDIAALDRALAESGYLGGLDTLGRLAAAWDEHGRVPSAGRRAIGTLMAVARELAPLRAAAPAAAHLDCLLAFLGRHDRPPGIDDPLRPRLLRARAAILDVLTALRDAYARFDTAPVDAESVAAVVRRWIDGHTFTPHTGEGGVHVVDADSARFGDFDFVQLAGLVEGEWPESPRRNIFYPPALLRELGWPAEAERLEGVRAAFRDLLALPAAALIVSTFTLEDDAPVVPSPLLDALTSCGLDVVERSLPAVRIFEHEALALDPVDTRHLEAAAGAAAVLRIDAAAQPRERPGFTTGHRPKAYSVSALERYQDCPFRFFAADVLRLDEPLEDEPARSPRARGRFIHEVFQRFFEAWQARGGGTITIDRLAEARALFRTVADPLLAQLPDADAALERARLFGSAVGTGIVDLVLDLEASHPEEVRERWIEHRLEGEFALGAADGRRVAIKGIADRIDLLDGNRLRVIDYKSGYPPNPKRALQVPVYALCAQEQLAAGGETPGWSIDEAVYVAFSGKRAVVPVVGRRVRDSGAVLTGARARLFDAVDGIERGDFPPRPHELRLCASCAFPSVCRKDYVGDE